MDDPQRIRVTMVRVDDPRELDHPELMEFGMAAAWLAKASEAIDDLAYIVGTLDLPEEELAHVDAENPLPWEADSLAVAHHIVCVSHHEGKKALEELIAIWLGEDPEHWPTLRLVVLDPWQERPGQWHEDTPEWVRTLGPIATSAHEKYDPFGRRPRT